MHTSPDRMDILFIVPYVPNLIRVRPYNLIRHLAARGHRVTVLTVWTNEQERAEAKRLERYCHRVQAVHLPRSRSWWNCLQALPGPMPLQAVYCWQPGLKAQISKLASQADLVHVEHLRGAHYGLDLESQAPVVWDSVDCISHLFEQAAQQSRGAFGRLVTRLELGRTRRYEGWLVEQFDQVLVTSEADKAALEKLEPSGPKSNITVLSNGVDLEYFTPGDGAREADTLVFSGKMSYHANATAAMYLVNQVMPLVWARRPGVRLIIAGSRPTPAVRKLASHPQVKVTGYLPDLRQPLWQASVVAAPLLYGAGIQNKVLEAMACGTPVVASPLAISALPQVRSGADCLVADTPQSFADRILCLLSDRALQARTGAAGRRYVETHHNWNDIAARLETIYQRSIQDVQRTNG